MTWEEFRASTDVLFPPRPDDGDTPGTLYERLREMGRAIHGVPDALQKQYVQCLWVDHLITTRTMGIGTYRQAELLVDAAVKSGNGEPSPSHTPTLIPVSQIPAPDTLEREWYWPGYVSPGLLTVLAGWMKLGKSTLAAQLIAAVTAGVGFCGRKTTPTRCAWVNCGFEQSPQEIRRVFTQLGVADDVLFLDAPNGWTFETEAIVGQLRAAGVGLVVVDTLSKAWRHVVTDENDSTQVERGMLPFLALARAGFAVLLLHHTRKSGGDDGADIRGSGAILGAVDIGIVFKRFEKDSPRRRVLERYGRFNDAAPAAYVLDYVHEAYDGVGTAEDVKSETKRARMAADGKQVYAVTGEDWADLDTIHAAVNAERDGELSPGTVRNRLKNLEESGRVARRKESKKYEWRRTG